MSTIGTAIRLRKLGVSHAITGNSLTIVRACKRHGYPVSEAVAVAQQESGFQNVYGHDPTGPDMHGAPVNRWTYGLYRLLRAHGGGQQGVGQYQLTGEAFQSAADQAGGCYVNRHNVDVAIAWLSGMRRLYGAPEAFKRYNGSEAYAVKVTALAALWHDRLK